MKHGPINRSTCIAVLPFENLSGESDHDYFAAEFVEDLITDLSRFHNLQVISSYTSRKIGTGSSDGLAEAKALAISYLLKGRLSRRANQIRITTQLIETVGGGVIWAERYDAPLDTIFDIQDDIVQRVAGALSAQIDQIHPAAARDKPLTSLAAYDCWLRGMDLLRKGTPEADQNARKIFEQALTIDPNYSRAHAGLLLSFTVETDGRLPSGRPLGDAITAVDRATAGGPAYYMINCAHPTHFEQTLAADAPWHKRLRAIRANASAKSHAELDATTEPDAGNPDELGQNYAALRACLPQLNIFGGCCGTDHHHVAAISRAVSSPSPGCRLAA